MAVGKENASSKKKKKIEARHKPQVHNKFCKWQGSRQVTAVQTTNTENVIESEGAIVDTTMDKSNSHTSVFDRRGLPSPTLPHMVEYMVLVTAVFRTAGICSS